MELPVDHLKHAIARGTNGFGHPVLPMQLIRHGTHDGRGFGFRHHRTSEWEQQRAQRL